MSSKKTTKKETKQTPVKGSKKGTNKPNSDQKTTQESPSSVRKLQSKVEQELKSTKVSTQTAEQQLQQINTTETTCVETAKQGYSSENKQKSDGLLEEQTDNETQTEVEDNVQMHQPETIPPGCNRGAGLKLLNLIKQISTFKSNKLDVCVITRFSRWLQVEDQFTHKIPSEYLEALQVELVQIKSVMQAIESRGDAKHFDFGLPENPGTPLSYHNIEEVIDKSTQCYRFKLPDNQEAFQEAFEQALELTGTALFCFTEMKTAKKSATKGQSLLLCYDNDYHQTATEGTMYKRIALAPLKISTFAQDQEGFQLAMYSGANFYLQSQDALIEDQQTSEVVYIIHGTDVSRDSLYRYEKYKPKVLEIDQDEQEQELMGVDRSQFSSGLVNLANHQTNARLIQCQYESLQPEPVSKVQLNDHAVQPSKLQSMIKNGTYFKPLEQDLGQVKVGELVVRNDQFKDLFKQIDSSKFKWHEKSMRTLCEFVAIYSSKRQTKQYLTDTFWKEKYNPDEPMENFSTLCSFMDSVWQDSAKNIFYSPSFNSKPVSMNCFQRNGVRGQNVTKVINKLETSYNQYASLHYTVRKQNVSYYFPQTAVLQTMLCQNKKLFQRQEMKEVAKSNTYRGNYLYLYAIQFQKLLKQYWWNEDKHALFKYDWTFYNDIERPKDFKSQNFQVPKACTLDKIEQFVNALFDQLFITNRIGKQSKYFDKYSKEKFGTLGQSIDPKAGVTITRSYRVPTDSLPAKAFNFNYDYTGTFCFGIKHHATERANKIVDSLIKEALDTYTVLGSTGAKYLHLTEYLLSDVANLFQAQQNAKQVDRGLSKAIEDLFFPYKIFSSDGILAQLTSLIFWYNELANSTLSEQHGRYHGRRCIEYMLITGTVDGWLLQEVPLALYRDSKENYAGFVSLETLVQFTNHQIPADYKDQDDNSAPQKIIDDFQDLFLRMQGSSRFTRKLRFYEELLDQRYLFIKQPNNLIFQKSSTKKIQFLKGNQYLVMRFKQKNTTFKLTAASADSNEVRNFFTFEGSFSLIVMHAVVQQWDVNANPSDEVQKFEQITQEVCFDTDFTAFASDYIDIREPEMSSLITWEPHRPSLAEQTQQKAKLAGDAVQLQRAYNVKVNTNLSRDFNDAADDYITDVAQGITNQIQRQEQAYIQVLEAKTRTHDTQRIAQLHFHSVQEIQKHEKYSNVRFTTSGFLNQSEKESLKGICLAKRAAFEIKETYLERALVTLSLVIKELQVRLGNLSVYITGDVQMSTKISQDQVIFIRLVNKVVIRYTSAFCPILSTRQAQKVESFTIDSRATRRRLVETVKLMDKESLKYVTKVFQCSQKAPYIVENACLMLNLLQTLGNLMFAMTRRPIYWYYPFWAGKMAMHVVNNGTEPFDGFLNHQGYLGSLPGFDKTPTPYQALKRCLKTATKLVRNTWVECTRQQYLHIVKTKPEERQGRFRVVDGVEPKYTDADAKEEWNDELLKAIWIPRALSFREGVYHGLLENEFLSRYKEASTISAAITNECIYNNKISQEFDINQLSEWAKNMFSKSDTVHRKSSSINLKYQDTSHMEECLARYVEEIADLCIIIDKRQLNEADFDLREKDIFSHKRRFINANDDSDNRLGVAEHRKYEQLLQEYNDKAIANLRLIGKHEEEKTPKQPRKKLNPADHRALQGFVSTIDAKDQQEYDLIRKKK